MAEARYELELELDVARSDLEEASRGYVWNGSDRYAGISIEVLPTEEHGFGVTEVVTVIVSVATGITVDLASDAVKSGVKGVIRRARSRRRPTDSSGKPTRTIDEAMRAEADADASAEDRTERE